jgi:hypothetical protein
LVGHAPRLNWLSELVFLFCYFFRITQVSILMSSAQQLAHHVFFALNDNSPAKVDELVAACQKYLNDHPGLVYFAVGRLNPTLARPVNDRGYDVSLHTVFADKAAHDAYQTAERHVQFINEQKPNWKQVRVFDSDLA